MAITKTTPQKIKFYKDVISEMNKIQLPYLLGGTYAVMEYTGIKRETKDLDFFCKTGDAPKILNHMKERGFKTQIEDERFVAKIIHNKYYVDLILGSFNSFAFVDDTWMKHAREVIFLGQKIKAISPEDLLWSKVYVKSRDAYHGADINHILLKQGKTLNWKHLLLRMDQHWEILLAMLLNFRFVYPSERGLVPQWLLEELSSRLKNQLTSPIPQKKISRGKFFSDNEYEVDFKEWGFEDTFTWT